MNLDFFFFLHCIVVAQLPRLAARLRLSRSRWRPFQSPLGPDGLGAAMISTSGRQADLASLGQVRWGDDRYTAMLVEKVMSQTLSRWDVRPLWATGAPNRFLQCFASRTLRWGDARRISFNFSLELIGQSRMVLPSLRSTTLYYALPRAPTVLWVLNLDRLVVP